MQLTVSRERPQYLTVWRKNSKILADSQIQSHL